MEVVIRCENDKYYKIEKQDVTSFLSFEYVVVLLITPATVLRIGVLYRPPAVYREWTHCDYVFQRISYFA